MLGDLTTLANVKSWMNIQSTSDDAVIGRMISSVSQVIRNFCQRDSFLSRAYSDTLDGYGTQSIILPQFPVTSIQSLAVCDTTIPAAVGQGSGYIFDRWNGIPSGRPSTVTLRGFNFWEGRANVAVSYTAGYLIASEAQVVPSSPYQLTPLAPMGSWAGDVSIGYANGSSLVSVASNPSAGQYVAPSPFALTGPTGYYTFSAADAGQSVLLNYSFTPTDIENVAIELTAERLSYRTRIGERSHSTGGQETVSFNITDFPPWARTALQSYRAQTPL